MKLILFFISIIIAFGCSNKPEPEKPRLSQQKLVGTWFVNKVSLYDKTHDYYKSIRLSNIKESNQLHRLYTFYANNTFALDTGSIAIIKGTYTVADSVLTINNRETADSKLSLTALKMVDTTKMRFYTKYNNTDNEMIAYEFVPVENTRLKDTSWKSPLLATATDAQIKDKLRGMLMYYYGYFNALGNSDVKVFNIDKIVAPIKLYSGGVGLAKPNELKQDFITVMGGTANAAKAQKIMSKCFDAYFTYPTEANYLLEYAIVVKHLSKQID